MADLIGIGLTGLKAHQIALSVTGNNVANTNTPGYSRQEAIFKTNQSNFNGYGYLGQGVDVVNVKRVAEQFVLEQMRSDTTVYNYRASILEQAEAVDNLLASTTTGLTPAMSSFFQAFQGAADDPTSVPQRQLLLTRVEGLVSRFRSLNESLASQARQIDQELEASVSTINSLAQGLVQINEALAGAAAGGASNIRPNELLDERDETLRRLSELVNVTSTDIGDSGMINVFIGNGQPLVVGTSATEVTTPENPRDNSRIDIALVVNGVEQSITDNLQGGKVGALIEFRDNELKDARNGLGRIAIVLADTINEQHKLGMDLENNLGGNVFTDINNINDARGRVIRNGNNTAPFDQQMRVDIVDSKQLTTDTYEVRFDGPTDVDFSIVRMPSAETVIQTTLPGVLPAAVEIEGFDLVFESGTYKVGDYFTVIPTRNGAGDFGADVDRVEELSFASPVRATSNLGNAGSAQISQGKMLDVNNPITNQRLSSFATPGELTPPLSIRFIRDDYYEVVDVSDPANPAPLVPPRNNVRYQAGQTNAIFTSDPGESLVSAKGADTLVVPAPSPAAGPLVNGYGAQTMTFLGRDELTGQVTTQTYPVGANSSAEDIAAGLTGLIGVQANAYTQVRLSNFVDNGDATPLSIDINGTAISVAPPATLDADSIAAAVNASDTLQALDIVAVSDGNNVNLRALTGKDIEVVVNGTGDSLDVSKLDPYTAGTPVLSTQTVASGQGVAVGGMIDVTMSNGVSMTASAASVFEQAPPAQSTYLGFTFDIAGEPKRGDRFGVEYNTDGISDNRNALAIAQLEGESLVAGGITSYGEAYSQIVEEIGTVTNRARLDEDAAKALLDQSTTAREAISGVNLDEEAGRLVQFQAAYNASAQVVSVARQLFDTLIGVFG